MTWGFITCGPNEALVVSGNVYKFRISFATFFEMAAGLGFFAYTFDSIILSLYFLLFFRLLLQQTPPRAWWKSFRLALHTMCSKVSFEGYFQFDVQHTYFQLNRIFLMLTEFR